MCRTRVDMLNEVIEFDDLSTRIYQTCRHEFTNLSTRLLLCYSIPFVLAPKKNKYYEKPEPTPNPTRDISPSPHARPDAYRHPRTLCVYSSFQWCVPAVHALPSMWWAKRSARRGVERDASHPLRGANASRACFGGHVTRSGHVYRCHICT